MDINLMGILVMDRLLKEDIQVKIIRTLQNLLKNTMISQEKLYQMGIKFCLRTTYNIQNTFLEFLNLKKIREPIMKINQMMMLAIRLKLRMKIRKQKKQHLNKLHFRY